MADSHEKRDTKSDSIKISGKTLLIGFGVLLILLVAIFLYFGGGLTGNVLATVNGEEITSEDVEAIQQASMMQGQEIPAEDAVEQAINMEILSQQAERGGFTFTREEIEQEIESQLATQGMGIEDFKEEIRSQGLSYEDEIDSYKDQFAVQSYIDSQVGDQIPEVSEEDARDYYEFIEQQSQEEVPSFEEIEQQIVMMIQQEAQQEAVGSLVQQLREQADIEYNI